MKTTTYTLELLTPCFCAGAHQSKAEIRAPAIRGQLRWWFRTLGGSPADERDIFGGVAGTASASSLVVRVLDTEPKTWTPPSFTPNDPESYVWYFASVSGTTVKGAKGPRWATSAAHGAGTKFKIQIIQRRPISPEKQAQLDLAVSCFLQLGAIGLRATRGLGAFHCSEVPFATSLLDGLRPKGFFFEHRSERLASVAAIASEIGNLVKGSRKANGMKFDQPSPFGSSTPRQTSAICFRPVRLGGNCSLIVFEAPHSRVLGRESDKPRVVGHSPSRLQRPVPRPKKF